MITRNFVLSACCFLLFPVGVVFAGTSAQTSGGTQIQNFQSYGNNSVGGFSGISSSNRYSAHGSTWAVGQSDVTGNVFGHANHPSGLFHEVETGAEVKSSSQAGSDDGHSHVSVKGVAEQETFSVATSPQAFASGEQYGLSKYSAHANDAAEGEASASGGSQSWAGNSPLVNGTNGTQASWAGSLTYGSTSASVDCSPRVAVRGEGHVQHAEFSQNLHATAWTTGSASYQYSAHGHTTDGAGFAVTNGSSVVMTDNGNGDISAHSESFSFSQD